MRIEAVWVCNKGGRIARGQREAERQMGSDEKGAVGGLDSYFFAFFALEAGAAPEAGVLARDESATSLMVRFWKGQSSRKSVAAKRCGKQKGWTHLATLLGPAGCPELLGRLLLLRDDGEERVAPALELVGCARLEEPIKAEQRPLAGIVFDKLVDVLAVEAPVLEPDEQETVLLLGVLLALILAVREVKLLHRELVARDLARQALGRCPELLDLLLALFDLVEQLLVACTKWEDERSGLARQLENSRARESCKANAPAISW